MNIRQLEYFRPRYKKINLVVFTFSYKNLKWFPFEMGQLDFFYTKANVLKEDFYQVRQAQFDSLALSYKIFDKIYPSFSRFN